MSLELGKEMIHFVRNITKGENISTAAGKRKHHLEWRCRVVNMPVDKQLVEVRFINRFGKDTGKPKWVYKENLREIN